MIGHTTTLRLGCGLALAAWSAAAAAEPVLRASSSYLDAEIVGERRTEEWQLTDQPTPLQASIVVRPGEARRICAISGPERLCETLRPGDRKPFTVLYNGKSYAMEFVALPPAAVYTPEHIAAFDGKNSFSVPKVYELVNIAIALTPRGRDTTNWLVYRAHYFEELQAYFAPVRDHPFVQFLQAEMDRDQLNYFFHKMSSYAYDMGDDGKLRPSAVYTSTNFDGRASSLAGKEALIQSFANDSKFSTFYDVHRPWYGELEKKFADRVDIAAMKEWLAGNFPDVKPYNHVNVVFSPLVNGSQSTTRMNENGFREAQLHMNFPYLGNASADLTEAGKKLQLGALTFTELNHNYINPTADRYAAEIAAAFAAYPREKGSTTALYADRMSYFNELMNWGLIDLYAVDKASPDDFPKLQRNTADIMKGRGFTQFAEFAPFLTKLYRERPAGTTLADLYPRIIDWFAKHPPKPAEGK